MYEVLKARDKKRVVLFNTHLDNIINSPNDLIKRLQKIFSLLYEYDIIILWRPHPLSKATIKSMSSSLMDRYEKLIEDFKRMPQGIYDDTADLERAIAVSDFYLGDMSSLVKLYEATKKPMMVLNPIRYNRFSYMCIQFQAGAQKDDCVYFSAINFNGFFKLSLATGQIEYLGQFKREERKQNLHCGSCIQENFCWFFPKFGDYIVRINLDTLDQYYVKIPETIETFDEFKFIDFVAENSVVWLIPKGASSILKMNLITEEIECFYRWPQHISWGKDCTPFSSAVLFGEKIIICPSDLEKFIILNKKTGEMTVSAGKVPAQTYSGIAFDGCNIWLSPLRGDHIFKWNIEHRTSKKIRCSLVDLTQDCNKYACIFYFDGYIWLLPYNLESFLRIHPETEEIIEVRCPDGMELKMDRRLVKSFLGRITSETELMLTSPYANMLLRVDKPRYDRMSGISLRIPDEQYVSYVSSTNECSLKENHSSYELDYFYPIKAFLDRVLVNGAVKKVNKDKEIGENGTVIWGLMKQIMLSSENKLRGEKMIEELYKCQEIESVGGGGVERCDR